MAGDFNARIGEGQGVAECGMENLNHLPTRRPEDKEIRYKGKRLIEWCEEKAMIIINGRAVRDEEGKITCVGHRRGLGSVLDLVLVKMEEELIPDWFKGFRVAAQEGSDHLLVLYRLSWGTAMSESEDEGIGYGRKGKLRWNAEKAEEYKKESEELWNAARYERGEETERMRDIEGKWQRIKTTITEAAKRVNIISKGKRYRLQNESWDNGEYRTMRKKLLKLLHRFRGQRDWSSKAEFMECRQELAKLRKKLINRWLDEKQKKVVESKNLTDSWKAMSWYRKRRSAVENNINKEAWQEHFKKLLNEGAKRLAQEEVEESEDVGQRKETGQQSEGEGAEVRETERETDKLSGRIKGKEILQALKTLKLGKAAGEDGITIEFLINLPEEIKMWETRRLPEDWRKAIIFPIHKNGDENAVGNYRGISLLDVGYKILATVMTKRLGDWLEEKEILAEAQAGFRSKRGTMEQVFVLNAVIGNRLKHSRNKLYTAFIDFKKAFDNISRERLWRKMENIGIKGKFLEMTKEIYKITWNGVLVGEEVTEKFETNNGVRQGCPLSPILFNIFINDLK